jgi:hypothetical protein
VGERADFGHSDRRGVLAKVKRKRRMFFSEEKNQKTFTPPQLHFCRSGPPTSNARRSKSLLVLFFRKEHLPYPFFRTTLQ